MYLKALEMQGFKSFPDKTVLTFNPGMTGVVGPNGSGKSNISDAVRWVLGEQSTKNLRGAKMEDVIFSGTGQRRPQGFAEVTLKLDNTDGTLPCDAKEVSVTRRFYRSGESQYLLNGTNVRLRDVHELFMDTGLGRDGYSIVSQGKIEDMVSAKSTDRRDMFEEAAGISHFRYRRTDALRRLDAAEENLVRLRDILAELGARVGPLAEQSKKAQKFLVLAEERKTLEIGLWLSILERSQGALREQTNRIAVAKGHYEEIAEALEQAAAAIDANAGESRRITLAIEEKRDKAALHEEQASQLDAQAAVYESTVRHNDDTIARIRSDRATEDETERELAEKLTAAQAEIEALVAQEEKENRTGEGIAEELKELQYRDESYADACNKTNRLLSELMLEISRTEIMASSASSSVDEIESRLAAVDAALSQRATEREALEQEENALVRRLTDAREKVTALENTVSGYTMRVRSRQEKMQQRKDEYENKKLTLSTKQSRLAFLVDTEKSMEGYGGSVKAVMREVQRGNLRGVRGTLSQLITVEEAYAAAIETALGNAMQDIVTENEDDAKRAIQFLKTTDTGRATFLPLTSVRGRGLEEKGLEGCSGFVSLAPALVDCDAAYKEIIGSLLGKTAVADTLDSAVQIARKYNYRFKIVTLDGQVVNAGGSITGGSRVRNAGFISRANEIERLKNESKALTTAIAESSEALKAATEALAAEQAGLEGARADLLRANEARLQTESDARLTEGRIAENHTAVAALEDEKKTAAERTEYYRESIRIAAETGDKLDKKKKEYEDKLHSLTGGRDTLGEERRGLTDEFNAVNLRVMALRRDAAARRESVESLLRRRQSHTERIADLEKEIAGIEEKSTRLAADAAQSRAAAKALREEAINARSEAKTLAEQRIAADTAADLNRTEERRLTENREKASAEIVRLEERKAALEREEEEVERKLYEEYALTRREAAALHIEIESTAKAQRRLSELKGQIKALGSVNVAAIEEYKEVSERYTFLSTQTEDAEKSKAELLRLIGQLTESMAARFSEQFRLINESFHETFARIFGGGTAELLLEDESDILECGIEIKAQPPGKNVRSLSLLSGGEKGLCAIALLFAILKVTPAPFCIFDEVEAALDDVNVARFAQFVRGLTDSTQFILITHRRGTMEEADVLYGVTMQEEGVSKLLELHTAEMAKQLGIEE